MAYSFCDIDNAYDNNIQEQINKLEKSFNEHKKDLFKNIDNERDIYFNTNDKYTNNYVKENNLSNTKGTSINKLKNNNNDDTIITSCSSSENNENIQSYDDLSLSLIFVALIAVKK